MKALFTLFFSIMFLTKVFSQPCIEKKSYKINNVFVYVDSRKMGYPFLVNVRTDTSKIYLILDTPQGEKEIVINIENAEKCYKADSLNYSAVFTGTIKNEDFETSNGNDPVTTTVIFEKKGSKYYLKMLLPQFQNSEFEIFMQEKSPKNEAKKN